MTRAPDAQPFAFWPLHHVQLAIPPGGEDRCRDFWGGVLGLTELEKPPVLAARGGCWFRGGELEVHLGVEDPFAPARKAHPGVLVTGLHALADRLAAAGAHPGDAVVLAAAGSSDPRAVADVERTAALLQERWAGPVTTGYGAAVRPTVPDAVGAARSGDAHRVVVAAYLLAPGHFAEKLAGAGADAVTEPLLPDERVAAVLLDRYDAALVAESN